MTAADIDDIEARLGGPDEFPWYAGLERDDVVVLITAAHNAVLDVNRLADALEAEGFVRGVAKRYGTFNRTYWEQSAAALIARCLPIETLVQPILPPPPPWFPGKAQILPRPKGPRPKPGPPAPHS